MHGGCFVPVGAHATVTGGLLSLAAQVTSLDGRRKVAGSAVGADPEATARKLVALLRERGAVAVFDEIRKPASRYPPGPVGTRPRHHADVSVRCPSRCWA